METSASSAYPIANDRLTSTPAVRAPPPAPAERRLPLLRPPERITEARRPRRLRASGIHGAQMRFDPSEPAAPSPGAVELPASLWAALTRAVGEFPGASVENKRFSFAI